MSEQAFRNLDRALEALVDGRGPEFQAALESLRAPGTPERLSPAVVEKMANTAALLLAVGQSEQVCVILDALIDRCGPDAALLNNLAYAHLLGGRREQALRLWQQASALAPEDALITANLARARRTLTGPEADQA